jgi:hypothetical protein
VTDNRNNVDSERIKPFYEMSEPGKEIHLVQEHDAPLNQNNGRLATRHETNG